MYNFREKEMELTIEIPNMQKAWTEKKRKEYEANPKRTILLSMLNAVGGNGSDYVGSSSFHDALGKIKEMEKSHDYSELDQAMYDLEQYYNAMENHADNYMRIARSRGYVICEKCGDIETIDEDENGKSMSCCGNQIQSEILNYNKS
jgi:hypothetical protein